MDLENEEEEEQFQCDICDSAYHRKCGAVKKSEIAARKGSKALKLLCPSCADAADSLIEKKMNDLLKLAYKIDLCVQQQKEITESNKSLVGSIALAVKSINEKVEIMDKKIDAKIDPTKIQCSASYASVVSAKPVKPAVVIKPKQKQHSKKTMEKLKQSVDKNSVNVCGARNARDGCVVLQCSDATETMKVKQIVNEKLGDEYEVILPAIKDPRVRITNINTDIPDDSIINELKLNNDCIKEAEMKLVTVIPKKFRSSTTNDAIIEVKSDIYRKLIDIGVLSLPWRECKVYEHLYLKRCFKCNGFSHIANQCKENTQYCSKCAGNHKVSECKTKKMCCINCKKANQSNNLKLDTRHHAYSKECGVLQRRLAVLRNKIEYNPSQ